LAGQELGVGAAAERDGGKRRPGVIDRAADQRRGRAPAFWSQRAVTEVEVGAERDFAVAEIAPEAAAGERLVQGG
jgi:hypothetical protein